MQLNIDKNKHYIDKEWLQSVNKNRKELGLPALTWKQATNSEED